MGVENVGCVEHLVSRLTRVIEESDLEAARRNLSLSEETNVETSLNEEQISEVDEEELGPVDDGELSPVDEEESSEIDDEELSPDSEDEFSPVDEEEEEPIDFDDPLVEQALREVNEEDRGDELSQTDEDQPSEVVEGQIEDAIPAEPHSTPPNTQRPKAPRAPRARQQWEKYSFRGKDGRRWTLQRRVPRERDDTPPNTPLREDSSGSEEGSPPAKTRRAHPPRTLFFESSDDEDNPTGVGSVASDLRAARVNELLNKLDVLYVTYGNIYFN